MGLKLVVSRWQFCSRSLTLRTSVVENRFQAGAVPDQSSVNLEVFVFFFLSFPRRLKLLHLSRLKQVITFYCLFTFPYSD